MQCITLFIIRSSKWVWRHNSKFLQACGDRANYFAPLATGPFYVSLLCSLPNFISYLVSEPLTSILQCLLTLLLIQLLIQLDFRTSSFSSFVLFLSSFHKAYARCLLHHMQFLFSTLLLFLSCQIRLHFIFLFKHWCLYVELELTLVWFVSMKNLWCHVCLWEETIWLSWLIFLINFLRKWGHVSCLRGLQIKLILLDAYLGVKYWVSRQIQNGIMFGNTISFLYIEENINENFANFLVSFCNMYCIIVGIGTWSSKSNLDFGAICLEGFVVVSIEKCSKCTLESFVLAWWRIVVVHWLVPFEIEMVCIMRTCGRQLHQVSTITLGCRGVSCISCRWLWWSYITRDFTNIDKVKGCKVEFPLKFMKYLKAVLTPTKWHIFMDVLINYKHSGFVDIAAIVRYIDELFEKDIRLFHDFNQFLLPWHAINLCEAYDGEHHRSIIVNVNIWNRNRIIWKWNYNI